MEQWVLAVALVAAAIIVSEASVTFTQVAAPARPIYYLGESLVFRTAGRLCGASDVCHYIDRTRNTTTGRPHVFYTTLPEMAGETSAVEFNGTVADLFKVTVYGEFCTSMSCINAQTLTFKFSNGTVLTYYYDFANGIALTEWSVSYTWPLEWMVDSVTSLFYGVDPIPPPATCKPCEYGCPCDSKPPQPATATTEPTTPATTTSSPAPSSSSAAPEPATPATTTTPPTTTPPTTTPPTTTPLTTTPPTTTPLTTTPPTTTPLTTTPPTTTPPTTTPPTTTTMATTTPAATTTISASTAPPAAAGNVTVDSQSAKPNAPTANITTTSTETQTIAPTSTVVTTSTPPTTTSPATTSPSSTAPSPNSTAASPVVLWIGSCSLDCGDCGTIIKSVDGVEQVVVCGNKYCASANTAGCRNCAVGCNVLKKVIDHQLYTYCSPDGMNNATQLTFYSDPLANFNVRCR